MKYLRKVAGVRVYELEVPSTSWGDKQYGHRRPYLYLPRHDLFLWGSPGSVHFDLSEEAKNLLMGVNPGKYMDYDFDRSEAVYGSYFTGNDGQATNSIWYIEEWVDKPEILDRIQQVTGVPVNQNVHAEAYIDEIDELDWALPPTTGSSFVDAEPVDKWWEAGCPNCENPDLDVKFHGGIECSKCGWEGDMTKGGELLGMSPPTEEYADSVWPDALPWDEAEQNYYRNAKIAAWLPKTGGTRLAGFYVWTADIAEKARMVRRQLITRPDVLEWMAKQDEKSLETLLRGDTGPVTPMIDLVRGFMNQIPDEGFKLFPWWMREIKKGLFDKQQWGHALDIAKQAAQWAEWSREHNKPMPDYMKKDFVFDDMQKWVYELNAKDSTEEAGWKDSTTVYKFEDGWHVDQVGVDDLAREGELMGHCVGGYCNDVRTERSTIYSFRDPKGMPHVTLEVVGAPLATGKGEGKGILQYVQVAQVQGKQDTEPIPEYRAKVEEWYEHLQDEIGYSTVEEEDPDREPEVEYVDHPEGPFVLESIDDMFLYVGILQDPHEREYNFGQDEDPEYEGNFVYYNNPRDFEVSKSLMELAVQFVEEIDKYDEDEIVEYVRGMWLAMNHLGQNRRYNPGFVHNPAGEWGEFAQQFKQFANPNLVITPKDSPRGQDRMFSVDPYRVDKLPLKVEHMLDYIFQIAGMDQEKYVTKHTRPVPPEGWEDQLREKREAMEEWKDFFKWEQAMKAGFPQEDYTVTRNYEFPDQGGYISQWDQIFNMDEWQWKPQLQAQSSWRLGVNEEGIASRALGLLHVNHGFSLDPLGNPVEPGYYVSYEGFERTIPLSAITDLDISNYMHDHANILSRTPDSFFGGWIDDNDNVILDVSRSFQILEEAQEFGRANHQDFLYDGFNAASIAVEYEAEMGHTGSVWLPKTTP